MCFPEESITSPLPLIGKTFTPELLTRRMMAFPAKGFGSNRLVPGIKGVTTKGRAELLREFKSTMQEYPTSPFTNAFEASEKTLSGFLAPGIFA